MNKSQKIAVWGIAGMLLTMALLALLLIPMFFWGRLMSAPARIACVIIAFAVFFGGFFWATRKQSKNEVETDELDIAIQKVAAIISLITVLIVVGVLLIIANLLWGLNAAAPLWVLMLLFVALVIVAVLAFAVAILVQYGRRGKNGE